MDLVPFLIRLLIQIQIQNHRLLELDQAKMILHYWSGIFYHYFHTRLSDYIRDGSERSPLFLYLNLLVLVC